MKVKDVVSIRTIPESWVPYFQHLMGLPVNDPNRPKLRDAVPFRQKAIEQKCRKLLSLSPEFKPQKVSPLSKPVPTYADWLRTHVPKGGPICAWPVDNPARRQIVAEPVRAPDPIEIPVFLKVAA